MTEVEVLAFALEVEESDLVLKVTDFVADRNEISGGQNGVRKDFAEERDFVEHFGFSHNFFCVGFSLFYI
tara:strand:+ start:2319 stop:2528 length:210 start_codon:yes stop_codon:yes gene_type:complete